jgi:antitoxin ParD1/3/4
MNVSLTKELEHWILQKVESGQYQTSSEVVREALRAQIKSEQQLESLRQDIEEGWQDFKAGRVTDLKTLKTRLSRKA